MTKKIKMFLVAILILMSIAGCSNNESEESVNSVTAIVLSTNSVEIEVDETYQLSYTILPQNADNQAITWSSADNTVASVNESGIISGISEGQTNIIVECKNGVYEVCSVTVTEKSA